MAFDNRADGAEGISSQSLDWHPLVGKCVNLSRMGHGADQKHVLSHWMPLCLEGGQPPTRLSVVNDTFEGRLDLVLLLFLSSSLICIRVVKPDLVIVRDGNNGLPGQFAEEG